MNFKNYSIREIHNLLVENKISVKNIIEEVIQQVEKDLKENFLITFTSEQAKKVANNFKFNKDKILSGIPYVNKDNVSTKDILTTAGSKILSNYIPPYDATVSKILNDNEAILLGKSALDELGMGGTGLFSFNGIVKNPFDNNRIIGGSSSGSAFAVCKGYVPFSIGTDTGDSIRKPASYVGIYGYKPTYGSISRYGVIPYAPSLDHVGFFTNHAEDLIYLANELFKYDPKDSTSIDNSKNYLDVFNTKNKKIRFGFLQEVWDILDDQLKNAYSKLFENLKKDNHEVEIFSFKKELLDAIPAMYMMISFAEGVSTSSNLDGINFGVRSEAENYQQLIKKTRTDSFNETVKRRFLLGSYQLKKENQELLLAKSKKVRRLVVDRINYFFKQFDIMILPPSLDVAPLISKVYGTDIEERYDDSKAFIHDLLILANLNGMPSITLPFIKDETTKLPIGINICSKPFTDDYLLSTTLYLEKLIKKAFK
ncbi:aspartyl/glutamyl-tRNA amidotransferase subunit A [Spiroplasma corruscae]|uniref:Aspartyl/glutamyl-tRNA amidotransferase subunit A n=1 Tax=Spiroplasma corruscae TaxID=216934 RepID=A0A222ENM6_9MOLU|nr:amidase family protein [Spiroplasma corruscae]ASP27883.1 aspartyl/glutamyl-tRNA amidotransferase subunit A [Spiroplasma corruscae]